MDAIIEPTRKYSRRPVEAMYSIDWESEIGMGAT
jgi:hypothetical protein